VSEKGIEDSRILIHVSLLKTTTKIGAAMYFGKFGARKETLRNKLLATMEENRINYKLMSKFVQEVKWKDGNPIHLLLQLSRQRN